MADREKVIKGLESLETRLVECGDKLDASVVQNALALLKAQEPVKPEKHFLDIGMVWYSCGNCGHHIFRGTTAKYCDMCGRPVKWDD